MNQRGGQGTGRTLPIVRVDAGGGLSRGERRDAAENRQRVLETAQTLFAERGVAAVSMHEIARAACIGQGTLYRRYANKGQLCAALLDDTARRFQAETLERLRADRHAPALDQLAGFLVRLATFNEANAPLLGGMTDAACGERRGETYRRGLYGWLHHTVTYLLQQAVERQEIPPLDVEAVADGVLAPLAIDLYLFQRRDRGFTPERITAALRRLLFDGLRGRPEPG